MPSPGGGNHLNDVMQPGKDRRDSSIEIGLVSCGRLAVMVMLSMLGRPVSNSCPAWMYDVSPLGDSGFRDSEKERTQRRKRGGKRMKVAS